MDRKQLQTRCKELKKYLPVGAACNARTEHLREFVASAERKKAASEQPTRAGFAGLVNDLLGVIAIYTNTQVTLHLLTLDKNTVNGAYVLSSSPWINKATYESRGLMIDPTLLGRDIGKWYAYYLMRNRTYYGRRLQIARSNRNVNIDRSKYLVYSVGEYNSGPRHYYFEQRAPSYDYEYSSSIKANSKGFPIKHYQHVQSFDRRIVKNSFIIDGILYLLSENNKFYKATSATHVLLASNIVDFMIIHGTYIITLDRTGRLHIPPSIIINSPSVPLIQLNRSGYGITYSGDVYALDRGLNSVNTDEKYLTYNINTNLEVVNNRCKFGERGQRAVHSDYYGGGYLDTHRSYHWCVIGDQRVLTSIIDNIQYYSLNTLSDSADLFVVDV